MLLSVNLTDISGGNLIVVATIIAAVVMLYKASPIGSDAVLSWRHLAEGYKAELEIAQADAKERFADFEAEKSRSQDLALRLARCEERPSTEHIAAVLEKMSTNFDQHRRDLLDLVKRMDERDARFEESLGTMHQALVVLVDRNRHQRSNDQDNGDPPLST